MEAARDTLAGGNVLVATEGSADAATAVLAGAEICREVGGRLHLVYVVPLVRGYDLFAEEGRGVLEEASSRAAEIGVKEVETHLLYGSPFSEIVGLSQALGKALVVVGSRGLGPLARITLGSVSEAVVHHSRYPVLVRRGGPAAWPPRQVVIADDGSEPARRAGKVAAELARILGSAVTLVRGYPAPEWAYPASPPGAIAAGGEVANALAAEIESEVERDRAHLEARAAEIAGGPGSEPATETMIGDPTHIILEAAARSGAEEATLTALGSRGMGTFRRMSLGSVSTKVLRAAPGPVLVHPPATG
jgi:nucleotide-binding universal stress UspA family protein